ncbi:ion transporter [Capnocytophaga sp.]|jgi:hypothetical protein
MDKKVFNTKYELFKRKAYIIIYGTNTPLGKLFDLVLLALIVISVIMVMLETVQGVNEHLHGVLVFMEWVITIFFSMEYALRIITNKKPYRYIFSLYGIIDLISILPMYLSFIAPGAKAISVTRALRLLRIFRILDLVSFMNQGEELKMALRTSRNKIIIFIYFVSVICVLLGSLMYVIEGRENGFTSIPRSIYWCIVTMTTVGYGDIAPATTLGQMLASLIMILGYGIIAVPTGIVTAEYTKMKTQRRRCKHCNFQNPPEAKYCNQCGSPLNEPITDADKK